ncbi:MAG: sigma-54 dependent transcriptional regulator [Salibacteraceae bacterium]
MAKILIIDDDADVCALLKGFLTRKKHEVETAFSMSKGVSRLEKGKFQVVLCDFRLPDGEGLDLLHKIRSIDTQAKVIIITGYSDVKVAINCIRKGAVDYVTKPLHPEEILHAVDRALHSSNQEQPPKPIKGDSVKSPKRSKISAPQFIQGKSPQSKQVQKLVDLVGPTEMSVVVIGDTGTGKEFVARSIHNTSERSSGPFIAIDCGALPKEIAASELFGHKKGSFTGALADKTGSFELANGGTLFLDEIANLSYDNQVKLLRVIQERKIRPIGSGKDVQIDVRIVAASNENLWLKAQANEFREDLYHRLNEFNIELSPLRERKSEIEQFSEHFMLEANALLNKAIEGFTDDAMIKLKDYYWHGNLRELKNVVKRAVLLTSDKLIDTAHLPMEIVNSIYVDENPTKGEGMDLSGSLKQVSERAERQAIIQALKRTNYNKSKTAEVLKIDRKTLYNKISAYGIELNH